MSRTSTLTVSPQHPCGLTFLEVHLCGFKSIYQGTHHVAGPVDVGRDAVAQQRLLGHLGLVV